MMKPAEKQGNEAHKTTKHDDQRHNKDDKQKADLKAKQPGAGQAQGAHEAKQGGKKPEDARR